MATDHEVQKTSNLVAHNDFSTFYATKEEIERQKQLKKEKGVNKSLALFFIGTAVMIPLSSIAGVLATMYVTSDVIAKAILVAGPLSCSVFGITNWFKYKKGVREIKEELAQDEEPKKM